MVFVGVVYMEKVTKEVFRMAKKIFSIPLNPMMDENYFNNIFIPFLDGYKDWIYDIYFTCRIAPFLQDAMGVPIIERDRDQVIENAMVIQEQIGITISATFNNINVSPRYDNYKLFVENLKPLYDVGLRSATIPHGHWLAMGFKDYFPEMEVKNTVLRKVATAQDYVLSAEQGFDYINLDRILMRDYDELADIKRAQKYFEDKYGRFVKIALLTNEGCLGRCPVMDEHYSYNNLREENEVPYFRHEISKISCQYKWEKEDNAFFFRAATIPPFKEEYDEILEYVQILKMHGRENLGVLESTIQLVKYYADGNEMLSEDANLYLDGVPHTELTNWRKYIKQCKFQCWDCNYCDVVADFKNKNVKN
jgi:hypothetical protein